MNCTQVLNAAKSSDITAAVWVFAEEVLVKYDLVKCS